ncbi:MAG: hypothetical protein DRQ37_08345 [Gammaproteobacteria bacterium]|nr:MAG: hypothetical protein DRQ37_08345 [Gammaproteobacteria bacterium]
MALIQVNRTERPAGCARALFIPGRHLPVNPRLGNRPQRKPASSSGARTFAAGTTRLEPPYSGSMAALTAFQGGVDELFDLG